jgi:hypothetical protein
VRVLPAVAFGLTVASMIAGCSPSPLSRAATEVDAAAEGGGSPLGGSPPITIEQHLAAGTDVYRCSYVVPSAAEAFLVGASHVATPGTHHVLVFRTDLTSIPAGGGASTDCYAGTSSPMQHMRGEVYGSQARAASFAFPPGVGLRLRAGEVFLVQIHFLNAEVQDVDASVDLTLTTTATGITTPAGVFFFDDPFIDIPPGAPSQASMRCLIPDEVTIVSTSFHGHARAQTATAFVDPPVGPPAARPYYTAPDAANPLPLQASIPVAAGSRVRFACTYQGGTQEIVQGSDIQTNEMCVLSGAYYPAGSPQMESCSLAPDEFGTGTAACAETLACVGACPAGTAPPADLGLAGVPQVDACWQRCVVASCPSASAPLFALVPCARAHCSAECSAPASAACSACQAAACPMESNACASDACVQ